MIIAGFFPSLPQICARGVSRQIATEVTYSQFGVNAFHALRREGRNELVRHRYHDHLPLRRETTSLLGARKSFIRSSRSCLSRRTARPGTWKSAQPTTLAAAAHRCSLDLG